MRWNTIIKAKIIKQGFYFLHNLSLFRIQGNHSKNRNSRLAVPLNSLHFPAKSSGNVYFISKKALGSRFRGIGARLFYTGLRRSCDVRGMHNVSLGDIFAEKRLACKRAFSRDERA
ncbi:hypothetical protein CEXT_233351 [Caerostris extrusa]|uniref:Uncharacterized protein n=1 Tax=Caerostris extrusa TaxID=172846 RepID=A0AAV4WQS9_CAEEX|nr:hypothetical protein CEXT_233351 [Caerostris extrusa]